MESPPNSDDTVVQLAMEAATNAAAKVVQDHLGVTTGDYAAQWWSGADERYPGIENRHGFLGALRDYLRDQRERVEADNDSVEAALQYAIYVLREQTGPIPERATAAIKWLEDILAQRDCANWGYVDLQPDDKGVVRITTRGEGCDRLTSLISTIIRG